MYVIATVFCSNFHFSVSLHVPFLNFFSNEIAIQTSIYYLLAKFGVDTAEDEPLKVCQIIHVRKKVGINIGPESREFVSGSSCSCGQSDVPS